ncbi:7TM diverse intracellular signaling domain-containing protein [Soonwooa sp.]|uniref:sensor histidine kinase n=1 Tax=Soonwooa sp. TaxID=1938592 RepID=UPI0035B0129B
MEIPNIRYVACVNICLDLHMFSYSRFFIFFLVISCSFFFGQQKSRDTFLIKGANWEQMADYVSFFEDKSQKLSLEEVLKLERNHQFRKKKEYRVFNSRYTRSDFWFVLPIKNVSEKDLQLVWSFYNNNFKVDFYDITKAKNARLLAQVSPEQMIDERPFDSRALCLPFTLKPKEFKKILAKINITNANQIYFLSDVTTVEDMLFWEQNYAMTVGQFLGYFSFMCLFNIFLFFILKQEVHLWHGFYVFSIILFTLNENIVDVLLLPKWLYHFLLNFPKMFWLLVSLIFCIKVFQLFTDQKRNFPRLYRVLFFCRNLIIVTVVIQFLLCVFFNVQDTIAYEFSIFSDSLLLLVSILVFVSIIYQSIKGDKNSIYFLVASLFILIAFINYMLDAIWQMQLFYFQPGNILVGMMVEVSLLTAIFIVIIVKQSRENRKQFEVKSVENQKLSKMMLNLQEEERKEIAQEIHDGVGSHLSGLKLYIQNIFESKKPIQEDVKSDILRQMKNIYEDLRNISHQLMPAFIEDSKISDLLTNKFEQYQRQFPNIRFGFQENIEGAKLSQTERLHTYRMITALVDNAIKHSECTEINCQIYYEDKHLEITVEDNGIGFNLDSDFSGIGIRSVKSRVNYLKGNINIESNKDGSIFIISIPIK